MRKLQSIAGALAIAALAASAGFLASCKHLDSEENESAHVRKYSCTMHPDVLRDGPGACPKCGMKLVQKDF